MKQAIKKELTRLGATNPLNTIDPERVRSNLTADSAQFADALSELTGFERVGMVSGEIYLRLELD
ncbi:hypothetical protein [Ruegeria sp. MALMAid1280]|uniref:hypothetical protein n=1 Tax=Ruegeria sp. MALMAid1280 TaxID=3411634 RepID=UPI003B9ED9CF